MLLIVIKNGLLARIQFISDFSANSWVVDDDQRNKKHLLVVDVGSLQTLLEVSGQVEQSYFVQLDNDITLGLQDAVELAGSFKLYLKYFGQQALDYVLHAQLYAVGSVLSYALRQNCEKLQVAHALCLVLVFIDYSLYFVLIVDSKQSDGVSHQIQEDVLILSVQLNSVVYSKFLNNSSLKTY